MIFDLVSSFRLEVQAVDDLLGEMTRIIARPLRSTTTGNLGIVTVTARAMFVDYLTDSFSKSVAYTLSGIGHVASLLNSFPTACVIVSLARGSA
ncbi:hypothetical protein [Mycobacterium sp.]|uniref:hypothetical protein n=1 Tax=Mycobacterium sp. TaxID=1785 RepID=UPI002CF7D453|nr:hypothetical protein [Mycobacterium sp.]HTQ17958.1 hypothetical protein [Mycobacterium sp.]